MGYLVRQTPNVPLESVLVESETLDFDRIGRVVSFDDPASVIRVHVAAQTVIITHPTLTYQDVQTREYGDLSSFKESTLVVEEDRYWVLDDEEIATFHEAGFKSCYEYDPREKNHITINHVACTDISIRFMICLGEGPDFENPDNVIAPGDKGIWTNGQRIVSLIKKDQSTIEHNVIMFGPTMIFVYGFPAKGPIPDIVPVGETIIIQWYHGSDFLGSGLVGKERIRELSSYFKNLFDDCPGDQTSCFRVQFDIYDPRSEIDKVNDLIKLFFHSLNVVDGPRIPVDYERDFVLMKWLMMLHERINTLDLFKGHFAFYFNCSMESQMVYFHAYLMLKKGHQITPGVLELLPDIEDLFYRPWVDFPFCDDYEDRGNSFGPLLSIWLLAIAVRPIIECSIIPDPHTPFLTPWILIDRVNEEMTKFITNPLKMNETPLSVQIKTPLRLFSTKQGEIGKWYDDNFDKISLISFVLMLAIRSNRDDYNTSYLHSYIREKDRKARLLKKARKEGVDPEFLGALKML